MKFLRSIGLGKLARNRKFVFSLLGLGWALALGGWAAFFILASEVRLPLRMDLWRLEKTKEAGPYYGQFDIFAARIGERYGSEKLSDLLNFPKMRFPLTEGERRLLAECLAENIRQGRDVEEAIRGLKSAIYDLQTSQWVAGAIAHGLVDSGNPKALNAALHCLVDCESENLARPFLARGLAEEGYKSAVPYLIAMLKVSPRDNGIARWALVKLTGVELEPSFDAWNSWYLSESNTGAKTPLPEDIVKQRVVTVRPYRRD